MIILSEVIASYYQKGNINMVVDERIDHVPDAIHEWNMMLTEKEEAMTEYLQSNEYVMSMLKEREYDAWLENMTLYGEYVDFVPLKDIQHYHGEPITLAALKEYYR
jgi:hypothetical protein